MKHRWRRLWTTIGHRPAALIMAGIVMASTVGYTLGIVTEQLRYHLDASSLQLLGNVNAALAKKVKYDSGLNAYRFNAENITPEMTGESDPAKVAALLASQQQQTGGGGKDTKNLYSLDLPVDPKKGMTVYDSDSKTSFKIIPQFSLEHAQREAQRVVYPISKGGQAVYSVKGNGVKEDIVLTKPQGDSLEFTYKLDLPKTLQARLDDRGNLGIYGVDPAISVALSASNDPARLKDVMENGTKNHLAYLIPAPIIAQSGAFAHSHAAKAMYRLNGDVLTVRATGLKALTYPISIDPSVVVTSTSDFASGNNEGMISYDTDAISRGGVTNGTIGSWNTPGNFQNARDSHTSVVYNGYVYVIGGRTGSTPLADVQYAPINANGTIGGWTASTSLPSTRYGHTSIAYNGYLYVIGGYNSGTLAADVQYAPINANGTLGSWTATTSFTTARYGHTSVVYNGYVYVIGGRTGSTSLADVQYAPINANGTLGSWTTTTSLPAGRDSHTSVVYNGYLYVIGGYSSSPLADVQYAPINANGTLGSWTATTSFTTARYGHTSVVYNGYVYVIEGRTTSTSLADVQYAPINANGTLGSWTATTSLSTGRNAHVSIASNGYVYVIGGYAGADLADVQFSKLNVDGTAGTWATATSFATGRSQHSTVVSNGYIYIIGGFNGSPLADVQYAPISASGALGGWNATTSLPAGRDMHTSVAYNGYLYVIGGHDGTSALADVQYAPINANGTIGGWNATTSFPTARYNHASVVYNGYLYVIGGNTGSSYRSDVEFAPLNANGTVGTWTQTNGFLTARYGHTAAVYNGYLYVIGGFGGSYLADVQYAAIAADGTTGSWTTTTSFTTARNSHASVISNGYLYILGGNNGGFLADVQYAPINANGTIGTWTATTSLPTARDTLTALAYGGNIFAIGGNGGTPLADIQVTAPSAIPAPTFTMPSWATTTLLGLSSGSASTKVATRHNHASVAYNGYLYMVGGTMGTSGLTSVQYAPLNTNGTVGAWAATTALPAIRQGLTSTVLNGYLYAIGGQDGTGAYATSVYYAQIAANGTVGAWNTTTALPAGLSNQSTVDYNGNLYVIGGITTGNAVVATVSYAPINANGTIGSWTATTSLPSVSATQQSVAYNGYLYAIGGVPGSGATAATYYAPINANGTIGGWTTTTSMTTARKYFNAVLFEGYIIAMGGNDGTASLATTEYAKINADGTIGSWTSGPSFTTARQAFGTAIYNGTIYIAGGSTGGSTDFGDEQYTTLSNSLSGSAATMGTVGTWQTTQASPVAVYGHASVVNNNYIYIIGGYANSAYQTTVRYAPINSDGTIGSWVTSANSMTMARFNAGAAVYNGFLYVTGGQQASSAFTNTTEYAPINADGSIGAFTASPNTFTTARLGHVTVAYNGKLYVLGGGDSANNALGDVKYASINADGSIGTWADTTAMVPFRNLAGFVYNGRLYVAGGLNGTIYSNTLRYATINADGTLGAWTTSPYGFTNARSRLAATVSNGYVYISGGAAASPYGDLQYAPIKADGSIGLWQSSNSLSSVSGAPAGYYYHTMIASNGWLYSLAGIDGTGASLSATYRTTLNTPAAKGIYTQQVNIGGGTLTGITVNGTLSAQSTVVFRTAGADGVYGVWQPISALSTPVANVSSVMYKATLDDNGLDAFTVNRSTITDVTVSYTLPSGLSPANRLRHNKYFDTNGVLQPLQTP